MSFVPHGNPGRRRSRARTQRAQELRRVETPAEKRLWAALRGHRLGLQFRRQHPLYGFFADFYAHSAGLVVEVDGPVHESRGEADRERDAILAGHGLMVLRFRNQDVLDRITWVNTRH